MNFEKLKPFQNLTKLETMSSLKSIQPRQHIYNLKYLSEAEILLFSAEVLSHAKILIDKDYHSNKVIIHVCLQIANGLIQNSENYFENLMTKKDKKKILKDLNMKNS